MSRLENFYREASDLVEEHDVMIDTPKGKVHKLCKEGYIEICAYGNIYRSSPEEHGVGWICWEPYHFLSHHFAFEDENATVRYVEKEMFVFGGAVLEMPKPEEKLTTYQKRKLKKYEAWVASSGRSDITQSQFEILWWNGQLDIDKKEI